MICNSTIARAGFLICVAFAVNAPYGLCAADESDAKKPAIADPKAAEFFDAKIRPLLTARCLECHGPDKQKGGLRLDSQAAVTTGGDSGTALVAGKPDESLLIQAIRYAGDIKMPPKSKLPEAEIALLVKWVEQGAAWPAADTPSADKPLVKSGPLFTADERAFWAFQPIGDPKLPVVKNSTWPKSSIDHFILAELEAKGLSPAPPADKRTLIRRATFDLTGLPPTHAEVEAFLADESSNAFATVVDRLLASPRYGERWGRHWLDVARYADSNGLDENLAYANAFRYRDYVVAALNKDKPFDRFLHEQIAGDLLPHSADINETIERTTATGFLSLGGKMLAEDDPVKMQMDIVDEQVDTIGRAVLGLTLGCARCHDHKYDPLPQIDYYALAGIFKSTKTMENFTVVARWQERPLADSDTIRQRDAHQQLIDTGKSEIAAVVTRANDDLLREVRRHSGRYLIAAAGRQQLDELVKQSQPRGPDPATQNLPGAVFIEAEDFVRGNVTKDRDNYGKEIGVLVNQGELPNVTEYETTVDAAGLYQFELRYAAAEARLTKLSINGRLVKADAARRTTGSWFPDSQTWFVEGVFPLQAGKNVLRLENAGAFPHIDKLLLTPVRNAAGESLLAAAGGAAENAELKTGFVAQWSAYLQKTQTHPDSPFAIWHEQVAKSFPSLGKGGAEGALPNSELPAPTSTSIIPPSSALRDLILADPRPVTLPEFAARYEQLLAETDRAWQELKATEAGKEAQTLADPSREALRQVLYDPKGPLAVPKNAEDYFGADNVAELKTRRDELKSLEESLPRLPEAMAVSDGKVENLRVHLRGSHLTLGQEAQRGFPRILAGEALTPLDEQASGRLQFVHWLTAPQNPLTSRVIVNRIWLWHFGEGLVRSPDNFGRLGERPTHPQLLDHLATELVRRGWSLKALHRLIMLSATYQMSTAYNEPAAAADPENRLWWRMNRRRLEAEAIRDAILAVAGTIDFTMEGSLLTTPNRQYVTSTASVNPAVYDSMRRSIYLPVVRSALYEVFQAFDFADPSTLNGKRDSTTVAPQALFMLNSGFVLQQTRSLAAKLLGDSGLDDAGRVRRLYEWSVSRPPTDRETARGLEFVERYADAGVVKQLTAEESRLRAWQALCRTILASNEFVYVE